MAKRVTSVLLTVLLVMLAHSALAGSLSVAPGKTTRSSNTTCSGTISITATAYLYGAAWNSATAQIDTWDTSRPTDGNDGSWIKRTSASFTSTGEQKKISYTPKTTDRSYRVGATAPAANVGTIIISY